MNNDYDWICNLIRVSEDILTIKPALLISTGSNVKLRVVYGLLIPLAITLAE